MPSRCANFVSSTSWGRFSGLAQAASQPPAEVSRAGNSHWPTCPPPEKRVWTGQKKCPPNSFSRRACTVGAAEGAAELGVRSLCEKTSFLVVWRTKPRSPYAPGAHLRGAQMLKPSAYGALNSFPSTAESVETWLDAINLVRAATKTRVSFPGEKWHFAHQPLACCAQQLRA